MCDTCYLGQEFITLNLYDIRMIHERGTKFKLVAIMASYHRFRSLVLKS